VILEDGTTANSGLSNDEISAFEKLDQTLKSDTNFQSKYPNAALTHAESNRSIAEQKVGRYYLRYKFDAGITEFWGHHADKAYVDCEQGYVGAGLMSRV
jgi:hypothetical protein